MGIVQSAGTVLLAVVGIAWCPGYARSRVRREGAATDVRSDGGVPREPDPLVRRGADHRLRAALFDRERRPPPPAPG